MQLLKPGQKPKHGMNAVRRPDGTLDVFTHFDPDVEPSLTQQQFKDDCDVNMIMERFAKTGEINHLNRQEGVYADLTEIGDYQDMLLRVQHAQHVFDRLPIKVKDKFSQDPQKLIDFLSDPANNEESYALGLREKPKTDPVLEELKGLRQDLAPAPPPTPEPKK